eukprot:TRINITY_DN2222_c0_g3_i1.p1 TRINITY_DN2222_c0_g3~~TRINITY_DN2222_c0_g3_i1.p1  ORF type:complete len:752 (-),score=117.42 TRINITY_DN2222_c0_g3_i1:65-2320(-)
MQQHPKIQQLHIKNILQLYIPLGGRDVGYAFTQTTKPSFGLTLTRQDTNESWHYQVQLISCDGSNETKMDVESLSWAKRNPYRLQINPHTSVIEGLILRYKINTGVFDFRRIKHRAIRFQLQCYHLGRVVSQGGSTQWRLLPKRRIAEEDSPTAVEDEVVVPVTWLQGNDIPSTIPSSSEETSPQYSSPYADDEDSTMLALNSPEQEGSFETPYFEERLLVHPQEYDNNQYMVLYNGNAEVIGNFRALNFYKASDINIKEDIRLLTDDRDPRGVLLKIDGVEYKFKEGLRGNTNTNKRFVGYIAQQIESVVPQAVQLIDGILHVDYESLIPYLSESIKQNFKDINNLNAKTEQIHQVVDMMYNEFMKERRQTTSSEKRTTSPKHTKRKWGWIIGASVSIVLLLSVALGLFLALRHDSQSLTPLTPSTPAGTVPSPSPATPIDQMVDMMALQEFYTSANGIHWGTTKWMTKAPFCEWEGVICNRDGRVVKLRLDLESMRGALTDAIGHLDLLQDLTISYTGLSGTIPKTLARLKYLEHLNLDYNKFDGVVPPELFALPKLQSISISGSNNFLPWEIPATIKQALLLEDLVLDGCNVVGTLPEEIATLPSLTDLSLENNQLVGTIPSLKDSSLRLLHAWGNRFSGSIPPLPSTLDILDLSSNNFTGDLTNINALFNLTQLSLNSNNLSGEFWLNDELMDSLQTLNIANNAFTSVAPTLSSPAALARFHCDVSDNNFKCPIPAWMTVECSGDCV